MRPFTGSHKACIIAPMPTTSVPTSAMLGDLDLSSIQDERIRQCIVMLLNLVEDLTQETHTLREENQRLRDEIKRLKGEQGKPSIKAGTKPYPTSSFTFVSKP